MGYGVLWVMGTKGISPEKTECCSLVLAAKGVPDVFNAGFRSSSRCMRFSG